MKQDKVYVYDTGLTFADAVGRKVLNAALTDLDRFPRRHNFKHIEEPRQIARIAGKVKTLEIIRRANQMNRLASGLNLIKFTQHFFPDDLASELMASTPDWVLRLSPKGPSPMLQVSSSGDYLATHKGHKRKASLFMLLQGSGQETRWYKETEPFEVIDPLRIPDHDKIEVATSVVMQPWRWYVFNHFEWHSVHNFASGSVRINMGLDFDDVTAEEIVEACNAHGLLVMSKLC